MGKIKAGIRWKYVIVRLCSKKTQLTCGSPSLALVCGREPFESHLNDRISPKSCYQSRLDVALIDNEWTPVVWPYIWSEKVMSVKMTIVAAWQLLLAAQPLDGLSVLWWRFFVICFNHSLLISWKKQSFVFYVFELHSFWDEQNQYGNTETWVKIVSKMLFWYPKHSEATVPQKGTPLI